MRSPKRFARLLAKGGEGGPARRFRWRAAGAGRRRRAPYPLYPHPPISTTKPPTTRSSSSCDSSPGCQRSLERASFWTVRRPQHVGGQDWASSARASLDERARSRRQGREPREAGVNPARTRNPASFQSRPAGGRMRHHQWRDLLRPLMVHPAQHDRGKGHDMSRAVQLHPHPHGYLIDVGPVRRNKRLQLPRDGSARRDDDDPPHVSGQADTSYLVTGHNGRGDTGLLSQYSPGRGRKRGSQDH